MVQETGVQFQVESYQILKNGTWYLGVVAIEKGALWSPSTTVAYNFIYACIFALYIYASYICLS